jgi:hypothetical protein
LDLNKIYYVKASLDCDGSGFYDKIGCYTLIEYADAPVYDLCGIGPSGYTTCTDCLNDIFTTSNCPSPTPTPTQTPTLTPTTSLTPTLTNTPTLTPTSAPFFTTTMEEKVLYALCFCLMSLRVKVLR